MRYAISVFLLAGLGLALSGCVLTGEKSEPLDNAVRPPPPPVGKAAKPEADKKVEPEAVKEPAQEPAQKTMIIDKEKKYTAVLQTEKGVIEMVLNVKDTPRTAENFIKLANKDFYNGTIFHRVVRGFMIQGGDPKGDGTGGPGYTFTDEPFKGEYTRGTVAMANAGPNTNGSQFFIMHQDYPLPKNYVIFGQVTKGIEAVDQIASAEVVAGPGGEKSKPVEPVKVRSVEIREE